MQFREADTSKVKTNILFEGLDIGYVVRPFILCIYDLGGLVGQLGEQVRELSYREEAVLRAVVCNNEVLDR